jgi:uncharacterized protein (TIGR02598 family)
MRNRLPSRLGFTLIEVSLAITIAAVALLAVVSMMPIGYDASRRAMDATRMAQLAEDIIAAARAHAQRFNTRAEFQANFTSTLTAQIVARNEWTSATPQTIQYNDTKQKITYLAQGFKNVTGLDLPSHELTYQATISNADPGAGLLVKRLNVRIWASTDDAVTGRTIPQPYEYYERNVLILGKDLSNAAL